MSKHTPDVSPAPWSIAPDMVGQTPCCKVLDANGRLIADGLHPDDAHLIAAAPTVLRELETEAELLDRLAMRCDDWARASTAGGWSTHQVAANRATADELRRRAAGLRAAIAKARNEQADHNPVEDR